MAGTLVFLALLFFAVQLLYNLYATSVVTAAAYDAARTVAGAQGGPGTEPDAERQARDVLGRYGDNVDFDWRTDWSTGDEVVLRVRAENPNFLLGSFVGTHLGFEQVDRTIRVRVERFR